MMTDHRIAILFLCTANSARSILAEAIANQRHAASLEAFSAGSRPATAPRPLALDTLRRHGLSTRGLHSKSWDVHRDRRFDLVITLCDDAAAATCPTWPGAPAAVHWALPDPPAAADPEAEFVRVFRGLERALDAFVASAEPDLARRAQLVAGRLAAYLERAG